MPSANERNADDFDCELYRLIGRARRYEERDVSGAKWRQIAVILGTARPIVRGMMDAARREETV